ncbi:hypothetical protein ACQY0O_006757 [Thecaphora frezii]
MDPTFTAAEEEGLLPLSDLLHSPAWSTSTSSSEYPDARSSGSSSDRHRWSCHDSTFSSSPDESDWCFHFAIKPSRRPRNESSGTSVTPPPSLFVDPRMLSDEQPHQDDIAKTLPETSDDDATLRSPAPPSPTSAAMPSETESRQRNETPREHRKKEKSKHRRTRKAAHVCTRDDTLCTHPLARSIWRPYANSPTSTIATQISCTITATPSTTVSPVATQRTVSHAPAKPLTVIYIELPSVPGARDAIHVDLPLLSDVVRPLQSCRTTMSAASDPEWLPSGDLDECDDNESFDALSIGERDIVAAEDEKRSNSDFISLDDDDGNEDFVPEVFVFDDDDDDESEIPTTITESSGSSDAEPPIRLRSGMRVARRPPGPVPESGVQGRRIRTDCSNPIDDDDEPQVRIRPLRRLSCARRLPAAIGERTDDETSDDEDLIRSRRVPKRCRARRPISETEETQDGGSDSDVVFVSQRLVQHPRHIVNKQKPSRPRRERSLSLKAREALECQQLGMARTNWAAFDENLDRALREAGVET